MLHETEDTLRYLAIIAIVPYSREREQQKCQQIYTIILLLSNILLTAWGLIYSPLTEEIIVVSSVVSLIKLFCYDITFTFTVAEALLTYEQYFQFMDASMRLTERFCKELQFRLCRRKQLLKYLSFIVITYGLVIMQITTVSTQHYYGYLWHETGAMLILRARCLQIVAFVECIAFYMQMLNLKLTAVISCKVHGERHFLDVNYKRLESLEYLLQLKCAYHEISKMATLLRQFLSWSLFSICTMMCLDLIVNTFWTFLTLEELYNFYFIYVTISNIIPDIFVLSLLCYTCEKCEQQCRQCAGLVQRLVLTTSSDYNTRIYNDLVDSFSLDIMQNSVRIDANDFFVINLQLLMKILVIMTSLLMTLMQFHTIKREQRKG